MTAVKTAFFTGSASASNELDGVLALHYLAEQQATYSLVGSAVALKELADKYLEACKKLTTIASSSLVASDITKANRVLIELALQATVASPAAEVKTEVLNKLTNAASVLGLAPLIAGGISGASATPYADALALVGISYEVYGTSSNAPIFTKVKTAVDALDLDATNAFTGSQTPAAILLEVFPAAAAKMELSQAKCADRTAGDLDAFFTGSNCGNYAGAATTSKAETTTFFKNVYQASAYYQGTDTFATDFSAIKIA